MAQAAAETFIVKPDLSLAEGMAPPMAYTFDVSRRKHKESGHKAHTVGHVTDKATFSRFKGRLDRDAAYVKKEGSDELAIPAIYEQFREAIEKIVAYEAKHSPLFRYRAAKLTVRQWELNPGERQDSAPWHGDRVDADAEESPFEDDIFTISDNTGTLTQSRPLADRFNRLSGIYAPVEGLVSQAQPYEINWMSHNVAHSSTFAEQKGVRAFLRLTFESPTRKFLLTLPKAERQALGLNF
jgi:hypothetical protein